MVLGKTLGKLTSKILFYFSSFDVRNSDFYYYY